MRRVCPPLLLASDLLAFIPAISLAFAVHAAAVSSPLTGALGNLAEHGTGRPGWGSLLVLACLLGFFAGRGHYASRVPFLTQLGDVAIGAAVALVCDVFLVIAVYDRPVRLEAVLRWVFYCPILLLFRAGVREMLCACGLWSINILIIAGRTASEQARAALLSDATLGYAFVGRAELADVAAFGDDQLLELLRTHNADLAVVGIGSGCAEAEREVVGALRRGGYPTALVLVMPGLPVVGLRQHHFFSHDVVMLAGRDNLARPFRRLLKTAFDQVVAALLLVLLGPLLLALAALVCSDGGPVFSRHRRIGAGGRAIECLKFRIATERSASQTSGDDPDNPLGRFLRRSGLDELPQLFNVLRGEMSLVGPKPIAQSEVTCYGNEFESYCETRPGLTGLWQLADRSDTSYGRRVRLDVWYVRNWTLWHDIAILLRTLPAVFLQRGAQ